jgi:hypothetical protein
MNPALILLPDFLLILSGFALRRSGMLSPAFWAEAEKFVYFILFPALLFRALARAELDFAASLPMLASGLLFTGAGFLLGNAAKPLFRLPQASFAAAAGAPRSHLRRLRGDGQPASTPGIAVIARWRRDGAGGQPDGGVAAVAGQPAGHALRAQPIIRASGGRSQRVRLAAAVRRHRPSRRRRAAAGLITVGAGLRRASPRARCCTERHQLLLLPLIATPRCSCSASGIAAGSAVSILPTATSAYIRGA